MKYRVGANADCPAMDRSVASIWSPGLMILFDFTFSGGDFWICGPANRIYRPVNILESGTFMKGWARLRLTKGVYHSMAAPS